jgi:hypothetical protein
VADLLWSREPVWDDEQRLLIGSHLEGVYNALMMLLEQVRR